MGKLVRDRIPEIVAAQGGQQNVRVLDDDEYARALLDKRLSVTMVLDDTPGHSARQLAPRYWNGSAPTPAAPWRRK